MKYENLPDSVIERVGELLMQRDDLRAEVERLREERDKWASTAANVIESRDALRAVVREQCTQLSSLRVDMIADRTWGGFADSVALIRAALRAALSEGGGE